MIEKNEAILITAGTRRIGFSFAKALLKDGYHCILHYRSTKNDASEWLRHNPAYASHVTFIQKELTDTPNKLIDCAAQSCSKPLTGLINNASLFSKGTLENHQNFEKHLTIHLKIPHILNSQFVLQPQAKWIINISDAKIAPMNKTYQNYRISKIFLEELTRQQAFLYAPSIRVNAIAPGAILPAAEETEETFTALRKSIPLHRTGDMASLIKALRYLIHNENTTGQILTVDGGWHLTG